MQKQNELQETVQNLGDIEIADAPRPSQEAINGNTSVGHCPLRIARLPDHASGAAFDSAHRRRQPSCLDGTRCDILANIRPWAYNHGDQNVYWLRGMAGTGKSTIALTIARELNENQRLGASFFFSRGEGYLSSTAKFVVTIAAQIAKLCPAINKFIEDSVSEHPRLESLGLYDQWDRLVLQPLLRMPADAFPKTLIIVIDALDECDDADNISALIHCLGTLGSNGLIGVRIFVTSRPGKVLQDAFDDTFSGEISRGLITHDIDQSIINDDLTIFYRTKLPYVTKQHFQSDVNIRLFVEQSQGLFIHAATVCRFVEDGAGAPTQRIAMLLEQPVKPLKSDLQLDKMYATVLQHSFLNSDEVKEAAQIRELFKRIVGSIMVLFDSLSACDLSKLIDQPTGKILSLLGCLNSVVDVSSGEGNVIRLLHPSFRDFVLDPMRCLDSSFFVDAPQAHGELLGSCLRVMSTHLHRNMGNLTSPGDRSYDVPESVIDQRIPNHVQYACRYWVHHLQRSSLNPRDFPGITEFFKSQFLFWLETLALLGQLSDGISMIAVLQKLLDDTHAAPNIPLSLPGRLARLISPGKSSDESPPSLDVILYDAKRFILSHSSAIEEAPLQTYYSAILFTPDASLIKKFHADEIPQWISQQPSFFKGWPQNIQTLSHPQPVTKLKFSPDGKTLATANSDTVWLWDAKTGAERHVFNEFRKRGSIARIEFSPNSKLLLVWIFSFQRRDDTDSILMRNVMTGKLLYTLEEPTPERSPGAYGPGQVAFSPDSKLLASQSAGNIVRICNSMTGEDVIILKGHSGSALGLAFSPDGSRLASGSEDKTVRIWDVSSGSCLYVLRGHTALVRIVSFSPNGTILASGSDDHKVRIWDVPTGKERYTLSGHTFRITAISFSANGKQLVSTSIDDTTRVWDVETGKVSRIFPCPAFEHAVSVSSAAMLLAYKHGPKIHTRSITSGKVQHVLGNNIDRLAALDFSPDGRLLASASEDRTVRLWDCAQGESQNTLTAHPACKEITRSVTVSPDGQVVATASELPISKDGVITRVWDIKTGSFQIISREMLHGSPFNFSPDGRLLALSTFSKGIRLWNVNKRTHGIRLSLKSEGSRSIVFSPDSSTLAVCIDEAHILIWDLKANKRRKIIISTNYVRRPVVKRVPLFFSPCGKHIACGIGQEIRLYDVASGTEDIVLKGHSDEVSALAFSPDGKILASAGWDGVFNLWDMSTQKPRRLTGPSNQPDTLCFSPNGTFVACASLVRYSFWDVASGALLGNGDFDMWSKHFAFSSCGTHFLTDRGAIGLSRSAKLPVSIFASQGWFWKGGVPFLYIHPDWRNSLQFVCGDIAVFLSMSGEPLVLRLGGHMGWEALK